MRICLFGQGPLCEAVHAALQAQGHTLLGPFASPQPTEVLRGTQASVGLSCGYRHKLKPEEWACFPDGILNLHTGYLPWNKGAYPNVWPILDGSPAGVTLHRVDEGIDTGPVVAQRITPVRVYDTAKTLYDRLLETAVEVAVDAVEIAERQRGWIEGYPQDPNAGSFHRKADLDVAVGSYFPVVGNPFSNPWVGESMYSLYDRSQMPWEWGPRLKERCHDLGLAFIASAYDTDGLDWLMANCVPDALKVASFEATDTPFVEAMASKGLPLIVSLGMTTWEEQGNIHDAIWAGGVPDYVLLHCVSAYPTPPAAAHLSVFNDRDVRCINTQGVSVGFSDHTLGHSVACAAVAKGACLLEKHIQLHPSLRTADSHFSATPQEFADYCRNVKEAWEAGHPVQGDPEKDSRQFRRAPGGKRGSYVS